MYEINIRNTLTMCLNKNGVIVFIVTLLTLIKFEYATTLLEQEKQPTFLMAGIGDYVGFNCELDFPHEIEIPYSLHWFKEVMLTNSKITFLESIF